MLLEQARMVEQMQHEDAAWHEHAREVGERLGEPVSAGHVRKRVAGAGDGVGGAYVELVQFAEAALDDVERPVARRDIVDERRRVQVRLLEHRLVRVHGDDVEPPCGEHYRVPGAARSQRR